MEGDENIKTVEDGVALEVVLLLSRTAPHLRARSVTWGPQPTQVIKRARWIVHGSRIVMISNGGVGSFCEWSKPRPAQTTILWNVRQHRDILPCRSSSSCSFGSPSSNPVVSKSWALNFQSRPSHVGVRCYGPSSEMEHLVRGVKQIAVNLLSTTTPPAAHPKTTTTTSAR